MVSDPFGQPPTWKWLGSSASDRGLRPNLVEMKHTPHTVRMSCRILAKKTKFMFLYSLTLNPANFNSSAPKNNFSAASDAETLEYTKR